MIFIPRRSLNITIDSLDSKQQWKQTQDLGRLYLQREQAMYSCLSLVCLYVILLEHLVYQ